MSATLYINQSFEVLPTADSTANTTFAEVIGNKADAADDTAGQASIVALCREILANLSSDGDITALVGALNTAAHTGAVDASTTVMGYTKQLITDLRAALADMGDASGSTLTSLYAILGNPATSLATQIAAIKAVTDALPDAGALTSIAQDATVAKELTLGVPVVDIATDIASISTLIGTPVADVSSDIAAIDTVLGSPAGASVSADIASIKTDTTKIGTLTNTGGTASLGAMIGNTNNIDLVTRLTTIDDFIDTEIATVVSKLTAGVPQVATVTTPDASDTAWTIAAHRLFTITGVVEITNLFGIVGESLVEGAALDNTLRVEPTGGLPYFLSELAANNFNINTIWYGTTSAIDTNGYALYTATDNYKFVIHDTDIDLRVLGTNSMTDGQITFYCEWRPISVGATVTAAVWD